MMSHLHQLLQILALEINTTQILGIWTRNIKALSAIDGNEKLQLCPLFQFQLEF